MINIFNIMYNAHQVLKSTKCILYLNIFVIRYGNSKGNES